MVHTTLPIADDDILLTKEIFIRGCNPFADYNHGMLKPILRAEFIRRTGLVYRENARLAEDFLYLVEFFAAGGVGFLLSQPLYNWTQPFGSLSRQWTTTGAGTWRYDFRSALVANAEALDALRQRGETALAHLLITRARAYNVLDHLGEINRLRATGATRVKILVLAARHPAIWLELARRLVRSVRRRASAKRHEPLSAHGGVDRAAT